ncbi:MAG: aminoacyl-histidine dipeptidase [Oscillospiraceae bacterium]|nr:aminoacyl-histidine dipeptidase [Oscillospiraceae bacterium]
MEAIKLAGLEPQPVFAYFERFCSIPHGSGNTKRISDYLVSFAKENEIRYVQDELNNVILFGEGTCGMEDHEPVIIQGHMDMVCEKDADCPIDMDKDGLDITHDGTCVYARGTTLGGDDGIAVAFAMALLADKTIAHPPLEVIITVDEETGMDGAAGIDLSGLKGRTVVNIDSEEEGIFTVSCAGGARGTIILPVERRAVYGPCVRLTVEGLQGGHSGVEIHKNRANANKVMGEFLSRVQQLMPVCITNLQGGAKDNAIPRSCQVTLVVLGMYIERINDVAEQLQKEIREQFDEPEAVIRGDDVDALGGNALTTESTAKVIALLNAAPNGVQSWSQDIDGLVQTSLNLGVANLEEDLKLTWAVRSSVNQEKTELMERLKELSQFYGGSYDQRGDYPAWEYRKDSPLRDTMVRVYQQMFEKDPEVVAIHAGLECGLLSEKLPGLDCVSIGPNMHDIHTSRERLEIESTKRTWDFLLEVLKNL